MAVGLREISGAARGRSPMTGGLRRQRFESRPLALVFDECFSVVLQTRLRCDALDAAIVEFAAEPPFAEAGLRQPSRGWRRSSKSTTSSSASAQGGGSKEAAKPARSRSRQPRTPAGSWSRQPGTSVATSARARRSSGAGRANRPQSARAPTRAPAGSTTAGTHSKGAASDARSSRSPSRASSPGIAGRWRRWSSTAPQRLGEESAAATTTRGATRGTATSSPSGRRPTLESGTTPHLAHPVHAVPTRAYQP